jgi:hypothetical protein
MRAGEHRDNAARFYYRQEKTIFHFSKKSRSALRPTQPSVQWKLRINSPGVKRPEWEVDYSPQSSSEIRKSGVIHLCPLHDFIACTGIMLLVFRVEIAYFGRDLYPEALETRTNML